MRSHRFICAHCGAPTRTLAELAVATCSYCGALLDASSASEQSHVEILEELHELEAPTPAGRRLVRLKNELAQVDRAWDIEQQRFDPDDRSSGEELPPQLAEAFRFLLPSLGLMLLVTAILAGTEEQELRFGLGLLSLPLLLIGASLWKRWIQRGRYEEALRRYRKRRGRILRDLRKQRASDNDG